jgi:hypothetical protein
MFRVDRIVMANINPKLSNFNLSEIPGFQEGKAPSMMKSLSSVDIFSPYWIEKGERPVDKVPPTPEAPTPEPTEPQSPDTTEIPTPEPTEPQTIVKPEMSNRNFTQEVFNEVLPKIKDIDGKKVISKMDYDFAVNSIYTKKEGEFKKYQRMISGNVRPGEGTRNRFRGESQNELNNLLKNNNIEIETVLSEIYNKFKHLIK